MMSSSTLVFLMPLLASLASAGHYYGSSMTFSARRTLNGTFEVDLRIRTTYDGCGHYFLSCLGGDCGYIVRDERGIIDNSTNGQSRYKNEFCETEELMTRLVQTNSPFEMSYGTCCWIPTVNSRTIKLQTYVDLGTRSDTRKPNRSPDIAIVPFLRVRQNCPRRYNLLAFDADRDRIVCRYGTEVGTECGNCVEPSGFYVNQSSCIIDYAYAGPGVYGFEMVVEDFPTHRITLDYTNSSRPSSVRSPNNPTTPLSKLPLQFTLVVDSPTSSCVDGVNFPKFLSPTPRNGERLYAEVNKELEIRVRAQATNAIVYDVIISGPLNITKHRTAHDEFVIHWTPEEKYLRVHFPICFVAESVDGSDIYQSEMRCVMVEVGPKLKAIEAHVICTENTMTVELNKASLPGLHEDRLRLSDPSNTVCSLHTHSNSTHIVATFPLNACGTEIDEDDNSLHFRNAFISIDNTTAIITRRHLVEVKFCCQYSKRGTVSFGFSTHRSNVTVKEKGFGTFTYRFEFFQDDGFDTMIDPNSYPLEFNVGERIYMEIDATSSLNGTELFVESCSAAPYDTPNYSPVYPIIENGCIRDPTVKVSSPSHKKYFRFGMEAFKFIGMYDQVYISCSVMVCKAGDPNTRCAQGCTNNPGHHQHRRRRREAAIQTESHFISQGPLRLRETSATTVTNLNMNLVFIAGCLLAAVGMICAVVVYKTKTPLVQYRPLEN